MKKTFFAFALIFLFPIVILAFSDLTLNHPNYEAIKYVKNQKIVSGYPDDTFKPDNKINRGEFTKIIIEATISQKDIHGSNCFDDVRDQWFAKYVCTAKNKKIINGYSNNTFKPSQNIYFVEASKIIALVFGDNIEADNKNWYKPYVENLANKKAIPTSINSFNYEITRGEMAEMIYRIKAGITSKESLSFAKIEEKEKINNQVTTTVDTEYQLITENNSDIQLIKKYYSNLSLDLQEAYNMKVVDDDISLKKFTEWYKNIEYVSPFNFYQNSKVKKEYKFQVILMEKNGQLSFYEVIMKVENEKLETISSKPIDTILKTKLSESLQVYVKIENNIEKLYLEKNGRKILIEEIDHNNVLTLYESFGGFSLTNTGNYLEFYHYYYMMGSINIFDIIKEKTMISISSYQSYDLNNFTEDEKYFYICHESSIIGFPGSVQVYSLPNFDLIFEVKPEPVLGTDVIDECKYENGVLKYKQGVDWDNLTEKSYQFK